MEKTKVSIIIPIFQVENYIERCIFSVIDQSYDHSNIECILIDDCGKDKSILIAQKCIDNYHGCMKFIVIHHKQNMGLSVSRNNGMKVATGDYIFFLDSDDYITPNCINLLVSKIHKNHEIEVIKGNHIDKRNNDSISSKNIPSRIIKNKELLTLFFLERIPCLAWNTLISRDLIEKNHLLFQPGLIYEDILWSFNLFKVTNTFLFIPDITLYYEVNPKSIVNANQREDVRQIKSRLYILKEFLSHIENRFYEGIIIYMTSMILGLIDRMKKN